MRIVKKALGILFLVLGLAVFLSPDLCSLWTGLENQQVIAEFRAEHPTAPLSSSHPTQQSEQTETDPLYEQIQRYNQRIFEEHQTGITDAWTFTENPLGMELDDLFGYIEIPTMDVTLPLYIGATDANMAKGAVILGQTSLPIGGSNTNSVIAGHRGYQGVPFFREIEKLAVGDSVFITNPWETLSYTVTELAVIEPYDLDSVLIQPKKDMVTLVTCHPYRSHGKYRYIAYCERTDTTQEAVSHDHEPSSTKPPVVPVLREDVPFESSEQDIQHEKLLRIAGAVCILFVLIISLIPPKKR